MLSSHPDMAKLKLINYECDHCNTKSNILPDLYLYFLYLWTPPWLCIHIKSKAKTGERGGRVVLIFRRYFDSRASVITLMLLWKNDFRVQSKLFWCCTMFTNHKRNVQQQPMSHWNTSKVYYYISLNIYIFLFAIFLKLRQLVSWLV